MASRADVEAGSLEVVVVQESGCPKSDSTDYGPTRRYTLIGSFLRCFCSHASRREVPTGTAHCCCSSHTLVLMCQTPPRRPLRGRTPAAENLDGRPPLLLVQSVIRSDICECRHREGFLLSYSQVHEPLVDTTLNTLFVSTRLKLES